MRTRMRTAVALVAVLGVVGLVSAAVAARTGKETSRPVKEFEISIGEVEHELYPGGPKIAAWGFNGQVPGPIMRVTEGDRVRVRFTNKHTSNHTLHFHGSGSSTATSCRT